MAPRAFSRYRGRKGGKRERKRALLAFLGECGSRKAVPEARAVLRADRSRSRADCNLGVVEDHTHWHQARVDRAWDLTAHPLYHLSSSRAGRAYTGKARKSSRRNRCCGGVVK